MRNGTLCGVPCAGADASAHSDKLVLENRHFRGKWPKMALIICFLGCKAGSLSEHACSTPCRYSIVENRPRIGRTATYTPPAGPFSVVGSNPIFSKFLFSVRNRCMEAAAQPTRYQKEHGSIPFCCNHFRAVADFPGARHTDRKSRPTAYKARAGRVFDHSQDGEVCKQSVPRLQQNTKQARPGGEGTAKRVRRVR